MAAVIDEQMQVQDFLEQQRLLEEERLRQEEAARLLAEQDALAAQAVIPQGDNFISQPQSEIDALQAQFNQQAQPAAFVPAMPRQMIGDEQYMNELARAQRGSGFVNALVDPGGNVITPGYDPSKDFASLKAQQEATNFQRQQYYGSLVQGGSSPAEAYRASWGRYPDIKNAGAELKLDALMARQSFQPRSVNVGSTEMIESRPGFWTQARAVRPPPVVKAVPGSIPPNVKTEQARLFKDADRAKALLDKGTEAIWSEADGKTITTPLSAARKLALQQTVDALELKARDLVAPGGNLREEFNPRIDQSGFSRARWDSPPGVPSRAPIPVTPTAATPAQAETVVVTKDGRRYSLPKSQLEEALKAGYKVGQ